MSREGTENRPRRSLVVVRRLSRIALALLNLLLHWLLASRVYRDRIHVSCTHQSTHGAVQSMPVVPPELGVGALERRVTVSLRLLDTVSQPY